MITLPTLFALVSTILSLARPALARYDSVPASPATGPSQVSYTYGSEGLDSPKLCPVNSTTFDWWYFDAVQSHGNGQFSSVSIVFYTSTVEAFALLKSVPYKNPSVNILQVTISYPNNTVFDTFLNASQFDVITHGDGVSGLYPDGSAVFTVASDLSHATIVVKAPELGVSGVLELTSSAPAHAPCAAASGDANLELMPHVGWVNAIPDSNAQGWFTVYGEPFEIQGHGYHDKNWGDQPFIESLASWYWGHAHIGAYSVVWFDTLDQKGTNRVSAYVAENGKIVEAQCSGVSARPFGKGTEYPPKATDSMPAGLNVLFELPQGQLNVTVQTNQVVIEGSGVYYRWAGAAMAMVNGKQETGIAQFEQFALGP